MGLLCACRRDRRDRLHRARGGARSSSGASRTLRASTDTLAQQQHRCDQVSDGCGPVEINGPLRVSKMARFPLHGLGRIIRPARARGILGLDSTNPGHHIDGIKSSAVLDTDVSIGRMHVARDDSDVGPEPSAQTQEHDHPNRLSGLAELNGKLLTTPDRRKVMAGIGMPKHRLSKLEDEPTPPEVVAPHDDRSLHGVVPTSLDLPQAAAQPRPEAGAQRTLEGVGSRPWFGTVA
jgi:hypothetical protein